MFFSRVNPNVGAGAIAMSSTAGRSSKFGLLMIDEFEQKVLDIFKANPWLQGLHQHIGKFAWSRLGKKILNKNTYNNIKEVKESSLSNLFLVSSVLLV